ncbi:hypothetical protein EDB84DRAFT_1507648 [Lactarius hengduanensis]|nr:hypothetical protein EDB84DRAFT_1507648 [Lactarius hengduanensis]
MFGGVDLLNLLLLLHLWRLLLRLRTCRTEMHWCIWIASSYPILSPWIPFYSTTRTLYHSPWRNASSTPPSLSSALKFTR